MGLLCGKQLRDSIHRIVAGKNIACAVAFWGRGAEAWVGSAKDRQIRLICNLKMGGTNPQVIRLLMQDGARIQQHDRLHAKIYINETEAILTSANASINGLGVEGDDLTGWIEAGMLLPAREVQPFFNKLWLDSRPIKSEDLDNARSLFAGRKIIQPTRGSFADYHPTKEELPLVTWAGESNYRFNEKAIIKYAGRVDDDLRDRIVKGFEVEGPEDLSLLGRKGQWMLWWIPRSDGHPDGRSQMWWSCSSGRRVPKALLRVDKSLGDRMHDVILQMEELPPVPFDAEEKQFRVAFAETIAKTRFQRLRAEDYQGAWFSQRQRLTWDFWFDLRKTYNGKAS